MLKLTCMFVNTTNKYQFWTFRVIFFKVSVFVSLFVPFEKLKKKNDTLKMKMKIK